MNKNMVKVRFRAVKTGTEFIFNNEPFKKLTNTQDTQHGPGCGGVTRLNSKELRLIPSDEMVITEIENVDQAEIEMGFALASWADIREALTKSKN